MVFITSDVIVLAQADEIFGTVAGALSETILGVVVILMILGYLWAKPAVDALKKENDRLGAIITRKDEELTAMRESIERQVIPSMEKNAHVADRVVLLLEENKDTARRLVDVLTRIEGR